jgi:hypothetical protein
MTDVLTPEIAADMHSLLKHGFPLTIDQQRLLKNSVASHEYRPSITSLGRISPSAKRCKQCDGTGRTSTVQGACDVRAACEACNGVGYTTPPATQS